MNRNRDPKKRALVTGGANGLGLAIVEHLMKQAYDVSVFDADETGLQKLDQKFGTSVETTVVDLSDRSAVLAETSRLSSDATFDIVVLNAGISATGKFERIPSDAHRRLLEINLVSPLIIANRLLAAGSVNKSGQIIFISSLSHFTGYPGAASYGASKDALAIYAKSLSKALKRSGISISCAFPGPIRTAHAQRHAPQGADASKRAQPSKVASAILSAARSGKFAIYPVFSVKIVAGLGRVLPGLLTKSMRKIIFEKLDSEVY